MSGSRLRMYPSGTLVDLSNPNPDDVSLDDIVHHLSHINRFNGSSRVPYSVAEHSVLVCRILMLSRQPWDVCWAGLMHDAVEAYLGDVTSPLKSLMPEYRVLEMKWENMLGKKFMFTPRLAIVKDADNLARVLESNELQRRKASALVPFSHLAIPKDPVVCMRPAEARVVFMQAAAKVYMGPSIETEVELGEV